MKLRLLVIILQSMAVWMAWDLGWTGYAMFALTFFVLLDLNKETK